MVGFQSKQNGGGAECVELFITLTKGWANQRCVQGLFSVSCIEGSSLDARGCTAATLSRYIILCESRGQRALNGSVLLIDSIPNLATAL